MQAIMDQEYKYTVTQNKTKELTTRFGCLSWPLDWKQNGPSQRWR